MPFLKSINTKWKDIFSDRIWTRPTDSTFWAINRQVNYPSNVSTSSFKIIRNDISIFESVSYIIREEK